MKKKYFGTDGIRALVGDSRMTPEFIMKLGWALGKTLQHHKKQAKVIIGKDTRISGYMFESALQAGLSGAGVDVSLTGPITTPAVAYLTRTMSADAGIMISASHNPYHDNGIKIFTNHGTKISDQQEKEIEQWLDKTMELTAAAGLGKAIRISCAQARYIEFCKSSINKRDLTGLHIVLDCANGAAYNTAPKIYKEMGARVSVIGNEPDGVNINRRIGSTHPQTIAKKVKELKADVGIALDGDGDRCIMVDHNGRIIDGDEILYIIAKSRQRNGTLTGPVVGTLMTNLGLENAIKQLGLKFMRADVGDKYVLEMLIKNNGNIGGESSGHILCLDKTTSGDGIVSSLQVLEEMIVEDKTLDKLLDGTEKMPQILINVKVNKPKKVAKSIQDEVNKKQKKLGKRGRILVRASGTEPLLRIMVEGSQQEEIYNTAHSIADVALRDHAL